MFIPKQHDPETGHRKSGEYYYSFSICAGGLVREGKMKDLPRQRVFVPINPFPRIFKYRPFSWIKTAWVEGWILPITIILLVAGFIWSLVTCLKYYPTYPAMWEHDRNEEFAEFI